MSCIRTSLIHTSLDCVLQISPTLELKGKEVATPEATKESPTKTPTAHLIVNAEKHPNVSTKKENGVFCLFVLCL